MTKINVKRINGIDTLINEHQTAIEIAKFDPSDLLAGALAKCTVDEVRKVAQKAKIDLKNLTVRVDLKRESVTKVANFMVHLDMEGKLSESEIKKLYKAVKKSYINRLLSNKIELNGDVHYNGQKILFTA